ncbi:uncharacterized protein KGF55_003417 [Candida pseudojiufengensis]|uniref:uncharacterized protein n=1 Tax=Candida pseudojiufengensis TaxID=497109 RepID=UPI002224D006|nr:uncharacterized protein KGF55_003417 [Candida pseudojiufengensis]KAI5962341.1 hypothetical protein KGF55_003417 [Candida pseudojiufengensis]
MSNTADSSSSSDVVKNAIPPSILSRIDELSTSPIPAGLLSASLLLKGFTSSSTSTIPNSGTSGSSFAFHKKLQTAKPTKFGSLGFGSIMALGTYMMIDGDPINASGFNFAWSLLYLIVNGKSSISSLFRGHISPIGLSGLALFNTGIYGREFIWSKKSPFQN